MSFREIWGKITGTNIVAINQSVFNIHNFLSLLKRVNNDAVIPGLRVAVLPFDNQQSVTFFRLLWYHKTPGYLDKKLTQEEKQKIEDWLQCFPPNWINYQLIWCYVYNNDG